MSREGICSPGVKYMAVGRKFGDSVYKWDVSDLHAAVAGLPVNEVPTDRFNLDVDAWFGEACEPTIRNVVNHMRRIRDADLSEPILLSAEGHVLDGLHRLAKCLLDGIPTIRCQQLEVNPIPTEVVPFEALKAEKPLIAQTLVWMEENGL